MLNVTLASEIRHDEAAGEIACHLTNEGHGDEFLYRLPGGTYFLSMSVPTLDGRLLSPEEDPEELAPELFDEASGVPPAHCNRRSHFFSGVHLSESEALAWCIQTQIPEPLRHLALRSAQTQPNRNAP